MSCFAAMCSGAGQNLSALKPIQGGMEVTRKCAVLRHRLTACRSSFLSCSVNDHLVQRLISYIRAFTGRSLIHISVQKEQTSWL